MNITVEIGKSRHSFDGPDQPVELDALLGRLAEAIEVDLIAGDDCGATVYFAGRPVRCFQGRSPARVKPRDVVELALMPDSPPADDPPPPGDNGDGADGADGLTTDH